MTRIAMGKPAILAAIAVTGLAITPAAAKTGTVTNGHSCVIDFGSYKAGASCHWEGVSCDLETGTCTIEGYSNGGSVISNGIGPMDARLSDKFSKGDLQVARKILRAHASGSNTKSK